MGLSYQRQTWWISHNNFRRREEDRERRFEREREKSESVFCSYVSGGCKGSFGESYHEYHQRFALGVGQVAATFASAGWLSRHIRAG